MKPKLRPIKTKLKKKIIRKNYDRVEPKHDWLKHWRVVRHWALATYDLKLPDLDILLYLYSEDLFSEDDFERYERIMSWSPTRFKKLIKSDWIRTWREKDKDECALYTLSFKGKRMINAIYKKLSGEETISESPHTNPLFKKNAGYAARGYKKMIQQMNDDIRKAKLEIRPFREP